MMRVLLYVDGSHNSQWALQVALLVCQHFQTKITLLVGDGGKGADAQWLPQARDQLLAAAAGALREVTQPGSAEEAILAESSAHAYDLILLAPAGRRGLIRLLHGSRVAQVVRQSNTSVLVARAALTDIQRLMVSVGGTRQSLETVEVAARWAQALSARAAILHVVSQLPLFFQGLTTQEGHHTSEELLAIEPEAREVLQEAIKLLQDANVFDRLLLREGLLEERVLAAVEEENIDLLVLGANAASGVNRLLLDDLCSRLVQQSPITTLVVR